VETLQTNINDYILSRNPEWKRISPWGNAARLVALCTLLFVTGIPYATGNGFYLLEIADHWAATYSLTITVLLEYVLLGRIYGIDQLIKDVHKFTSVKLPNWTKYQVLYVAPLMMVLVLAFLVAGEFAGQTNFHAVGSGYCNNFEGAYADVDAPQPPPSYVLSLDKCQAKCLEENRCKIVSYIEGHQCVRYDHRAGSCSKRPLFESHHFRIQTYTKADHVYYPGWAKAFFGYLPCIAVVSTFFIPIVRFQVQRVLFGGPSLEPASAEAVRQRAMGAGLQPATVLEGLDESQTVGLSTNRA